MAGKYSNENNQKIIRKTSREQSHKQTEKYIFVEFRESLISEKEKLHEKSFFCFTYKLKASYFFEY